MHEATGIWRAGGRLGPLTIERELGRGGMGVVYLARDASGGHRAVKCLPLGGEAKALERFHREGQAQARVDALPPEPCEDWELRDEQGAVRLSQLFGAPEGPGAYRAELALGDTPALPLLSAQSDERQDFELSGRAAFADGCLRSLELHQTVRRGEERSERSSFEAQVELRRAP
ncbi:MAG: hypothetical protein AB7N76_18450 [Planctomycetota bacterium]